MHKLRIMYGSKRWLYYIFLKISFIYFYREGKRGRKRGNEIPMCKRYIDWLPLILPPLGAWPTTQACALTGNLNWRPLRLQAGAQSTEPHQPGLYCIFFLLMGQRVKKWNILRWVEPLPDWRWVENKPPILQKHRHKNAYWVLTVY